MQCRFIEPVLVYSYIPTLNYSLFVVHYSLLTINCSLFFSFLAHVGEQDHITD